MPFSVIFASKYVNSQDQNKPKVDGRFLFLDSLMLVVLQQVLTSDLAVKSSTTLLQRILLRLCDEDLTIALDQIATAWCVEGHGISYWDF